MNPSYLQYLVCPLCQGSFTQTDGMLICAKRHTFDLAREGYVHFLPKRAVPGDTREMLLARRRFFSLGHYGPLSAMLNETLASHLVWAARRDMTLPLAVLDAGCGEGYYLGNVQCYLTGRGMRTCCMGVDVSKEAVRMAAREYREAFFLVANLRDRLTFGDASLDAVLNIFAPRNAPEFARIIVPDGLLLAIIPTSAHLQDLRSALHLLTIEEQKREHVVEQFTDGNLFRLEAGVDITYPLDLQQDEITQIVTMTPNYWHLTNETRQLLATLREIRTEVSCTCLVFRRTTA